MQDGDGIESKKWPNMATGTNNTIATAAKMASKRQFVVIFTTVYFSLNCRLAVKFLAIGCISIC